MTNWQPPKVDISWDVTVTPAEARVLTGVCRGLTNRHIALATHTSDDTIKCHVKSLLRKTGMRSRTQLAVAALTGALNVTVLKKPNNPARAAA